jgi:hypothetical protein
MALDIFGNLFGGNTTTGLDALLSADQRKLMGRNANLSAAAALLAASGRSRQRVGLGQALGSALQAGQQGYQQARAGSLQEMLLGEKLREGQTARQVQQRVAGALTTTPSVLTPEQQALAAPGGQVGPTVQRAEMASATPEMTPNQIKAMQYQNAADVLAAAGRVADAEKYQSMAEKLNPREEVTGQPFEVTGANGQPLLVQQMKSGKLQTLQGFGPKREVVLQNLGGQTVAVDKSALRGGETFQQTMTPGETASNIIAQGNLAVSQGQLGVSQGQLGVSQGNLAVSQGQLGVARGGLALRGQEFARGAFDRVDTPEGMMYVPKTPGGAAMPVTGPSGQPLRGSGGTPTEGQSNAAGYAQRMELAESIINRLPAGSQPGAGTRIAEAVPFIGGALARGVQPAATQQYDQAAQDWIRAKLRKESGAAIGVDEMKQEFATYFPQVNDTPEKIAQKAEARRVATLGMQKSAGRAYEPYVPPAPAPAPAAARPARLVFDPMTRVYRYVQE